MSLPSACLHSQGPHLAVSGRENWENNRLVRAKALTANIKERGRERGAAAIGAHNKHSSFTAHPGHSGKVGRPLNGKGSNKKTQTSLKRVLCMCMPVFVCSCLPK